MEWNTTIWLGLTIPTECGSNRRGVAKLRNRTSLPRRWCNSTQFSSNFWHKYNSFLYLKTNWNPFQSELVHLVWYSYPHFEIVDSTRSTVVLATWSPLGEHNVYMHVCTVPAQESYCIIRLLTRFGFKKTKNKNKNGRKFHSIHCFVEIHLNSMI